MYGVGALERYSHICVFKLICTLANYWAVICESCPGFYISDIVIIPVIVVLSCCNWEFSFWISVCGKLLVCAAYCITVSCFFFLSGVSESECIRVM